MEAKPEDYEKIAKIQFNSGYDPTYEWEKETRLAKDFLEKTNERVFLAKFEGEFAGFISIDPEGDLSIVISKNFQGKGIANKMMDFIVDFTKKENYKFLKLDVRKDNNKVINLYNKFGFAKKRSLSLTEKAILICF